MELPWGELRSRANEIAKSAYVPYSKYPVGAAALATDGNIYVGCNVENASYGVGLCAECGLVSALAAGNGGRLLAFCCVNGADELIMPCGRCRQLLFEHGGDELQVLTPLGQLSMAEVLPQASGQPI